jgi:hypothetical protein
LIDICVHGHVNVCGYVAYNFEYCARVGLLILTVFVTLSNEVYSSRIVNMMVNKMMNTLVDILSFWSSYSSVEGGTDGNKLRFWKKYFVPSHNAETCLRIFATRIKDKVHYNYNEDSLLKRVSYESFKMVTWQFLPSSWRIKDQGWARELTGRWGRRQECGGEWKYEQGWYLHLLSIHIYFTLD